MLSLLPSEVLKHHVLPHLDNVAFFLLQEALCIYNIKKQTVLLQDYYQRQIMKAGVSVFSYLYELPIPITTANFLTYKGLIDIRTMYINAVRVDALEIVQHLMTPDGRKVHMKLYWPRDILNIAAQCGSIRCLKWFLETFPRYYDERYLLEYAVMGGNIECVAYLHDKHKGWHPILCSRAAEFGHLPCLQYLHEHGYVWDSDTTDNAAIFGHLDCLQYALANGCPWEPNGNTMDYIHINGHLDIIRFLFSKDMISHDFMMHGCIAVDGDLQLTKFLFDAGYSIDHLIFSSIKGGHVNCLEFLISQGILLNIKYPDYAAQFGRLDCLKCLYKHKCPWNTREITMFISFTDRHIFNWLATTK